MDTPPYTPPPPETIGHGSSSGTLPGHVPVKFTPPAPRPAPQREQLAAAFYEEFFKKRYQATTPYPWESVCSFQPDERDAWLAVADMAILNLCS